MIVFNVDNFLEFEINVQTGKSIRMAGYKINLHFKTDKKEECLHSIKGYVILGIENE